jgi:hypothetical protein
VDYGNANWGLAYPGVAYTPVVLVPRPPRPPAVTWAVALTYAGMGFSALAEVAALAGAASTFTLVPWIPLVAGTAAAAILTQRGSNAARIVLACLMGLFAVVGLCVGVVGLRPPPTGWQMFAVALAVVLAGLAVVIGVLLLVPAANRYFSAGPGRRFSPLGPDGVPWTGAGA